MPADDRHVGIHYQRIRKAEFLNGLLDFSYSLSPGFSFFRGLYAAGFRTLTGSTFNSAVFFKHLLVILPVFIKCPPASHRAEGLRPTSAFVTDRSAAPRTEPFRDIPFKIAIFLHFLSSKIRCSCRIIRRKRYHFDCRTSRSRRIKYLMKRQNTAFLR